MIIAITYIVIGISTALVVRNITMAARVGVVLTWPLYWFSFVYAHFVGWVPAKCAWCGKSVAGHAKKEAWRAHYLDECKDHPLAAKVRHLEKILGEDTALIRKLHDELEPYRAIQRKMYKDMTTHIDDMLLRGHE